MHLNKNQIKLFLEDPEEYVLNYEQDEIKYLQKQYGFSKEEAIKRAISQVREAISEDE